MQCPVAADGAVAAEDRPRIAPHDREDRDRGAERHAAEKRVVGPQKQAQPARQPRPDRRVEIVRFRVVIGVGQALVPVMREMQVAKPAIGKEEPDRHEDQRLVELSGPERMAVQHLVLERGMQRHRER